MIIYKLLCPISKARLGGDQRIFLECSGKTQSTGRFCLVYMGLKKKKKKKKSQHFTLRAQEISQKTQVSTENKTEVLAAWVPL